MRLSLVAVGTRMPTWVREGYEDYSRRMKPRLPVTLQELPPGKRTASGDDARAIVDEGRRILTSVKPQDYVVALDERGRQRSSVELSVWLEERMKEGRDVAFLIGGPDGFAPEVLQRAQETWSLSRMTLPHALVRVMFIEQLYRAVTLVDGHPYHREWTMPPDPVARLLLASASPRRSELLRQLRVAHRIAAADVDETPLPAETAEDLVTRLACAKAFAGLPFAAGLPVLGADTVVVLGERIFGKPADRTDALRMLTALAGRTHRVLSAVAVTDGTGHIEQGLSESHVTLRALKADEVQAYWDTGEPAGKAGGYAVQGLAAVFIQELRGSYSGVMGLPLFETARLLRGVGIDVLGGRGT